MTLEVLFARQLQCQTFLRLCLIGLAAGMLLQLSRPIRRRGAVWGVLWDIACSTVLALAVAWVMLLSHAGVRLYGLLGLMLGLLLYAAGVGRLVALVTAWIKKMHRK